MSQPHLPAAPISAAAAPQPAHEPFSARRVIVEVPATCANLGPGFDCVAIALSIRNTFDVTVEPRHAAGPAACRVELVAPATGEPSGAPEIALGSDNLFCQAFARLCERQGVAPPDLHVRITAPIPTSRGLGSSATAVVGGLLAANTLLGRPCATAELLALATACEPGGHADNVAAALLGGLVVTGADAGGAIVALPLPIPEALRAVVFIPDMPMSTVAGRALLPERYTRDDVAFNLSRLALLLGALQTGRFDTLATAMDDRVHQPYRQRLFPALRPLLAAALAAGAHGACLSGGGSSVLALVSDNAEQTRLALVDAAKALGVGGRCVIAEIARAGAAATLKPDATAQTPDEERP